MKQPIVISVSPDGVVEGMHRDEFDLSFLGAQKIVRASDIRFQETSQRWRIWVNLQPERGQGKEHYVWLVSTGEFDSYEEARDFEVLWLNECRMRDILPSEENRMGIAALALVLQSKNITIQ